MSDMTKIWRCPQGHIMGQVVRNGSGVRRLLLYRQALDPELATAQDEVDVMAVVEGYVADVRCSVCGSVRHWVPGAESLRLLIESVNRLRSNVE